MTVQLHMFRPFMEDWVFGNVESCLAIRVNRDRQDRRCREVIQKPYKPGRPIGVTKSHHIKRRITGEEDTLCWICAKIPQYSKCSCVIRKSGTLHELTEG